MVHNTRYRSSIAGLIVFKSYSGVLTAKSTVSRSTNPQIGVELGMERRSCSGAWKVEVGMRNYPSFKRRETTRRVG